MRHCSSLIFSLFPFKKLLHNLFYTIAENFTFKTFLLFFSSYSHPQKSTFYTPNHLCHHLNSVLSSPRINSKQIKIFLLVRSSRRKIVITLNNNNINSKRKILIFHFITFMLIVFACCYYSRLFKRWLVCNLISKEFK